MHITTIENYRLTQKIIGAAIEVHRELGPGLLESMYEECFCYELTSLNLQFERQKMIPLIYKGQYINMDYRLDLMIENEIIVEIKCVNELLSIHEAQVLSYLKITKRNLGLLINFNANLIKNGIRRLVL